MIDSKWAYEIKPEQCEDFGSYVCAIIIYAKTDTYTDTYKAEKSLIDYMLNIIKTRNKFDP